MKRNSDSNVLNRVGGDNGKPTKKKLVGRPNHIAKKSRCTIVICHYFYGSHKNIKYSEMFL